MQLHLGGHLSWYDANKRAWLNVPLPEPMPLMDLVSVMGLPQGEIAIAVVNGRTVTLTEAQVEDGDRVELYPPIGGG
jgi:sulfur carrier protein ThiS